MATRAASKSEQKQYAANGQRGGGCLDEVRGGFSVFSNHWARPCSEPLGMLTHDMAGVLRSTLPGKPGGNSRREFGRPRAENQHWRGIVVDTGYLEIRRAGSNDTTRRDR